jgi:hypothetical protein
MMIESIPGPKGKVQVCGMQILCTSLVSERLFQATGRYMQVLSSLMPERMELSYQCRSKMTPGARPLISCTCFLAWGDTWK